MATFTMCKDTAGRTIYVNADLVRLIDPTENYTLLRFDRDHVIAVSDPASVIANAADAGKKL
jgi:hypothetical protein